MNAPAKPPAPIALFPVPMDEFVESIVARVVERLSDVGAGSGAAVALLDRRGLAEKLGCCVDVVDRLRSEGLPEIKLIDAPRFELAACLEWLRGRASK